MSKKRRKKNKPAVRQPQTSPSKMNTKYSAGELAMAILGAALVIMVGVIIVTSLLE